MVRNHHHHHPRYQFQEYQHVPLVNCMELQLRFLSPQDLDQVKATPQIFLWQILKYFFQVKMLCRDWFPIDYPDTWYQEITSNPRFFSLAATLSGSIIGLIVAETKELAQLAKEDRSLLANCFLSNTKVIFPVWLCDQWLNISRLVIFCLLECANLTGSRVLPACFWISWSRTSITTSVIKSKLCIYTYWQQILKL